MVLLNGEELLARGLVVRLQLQSVGIVSHEAPIADPAVITLALMVVAKNIKVRVLACRSLIPLCDSLVHRDRDSTHTTGVSNGIPVMKTNLPTKDIEVIVIPLRELEVYTFIFRVQFLEE